MNIFAGIGRLFLSFLAEVGRLTSFTLAAVTSIVRPPVYWRLILQQLMRIGWKFFLPLSLIWVVITAGYLIVFDKLPKVGP